VSELSTRELMFEAASLAYEDAGIDPRTEVGSFITTGEDLWEGWSITDEMVPDQIGGAGRPVCTIPGDALTGLGNAVMQLEAGVAEVCVVEAHSKASEVMDKERVERLAQEPSLVRPLGLGSDTIVALEMGAFMQESDFDLADCDAVISRSRKNGAANPLASFPANRAGSDRDIVLSSPLRRKDRADYADAAIVAVIASRSWVERRKGNEGRDMASRRAIDRAIGVEGIAWSSSLPWLDGAEARTAGYARLSFESAARRSGLTITSTTATAKATMTGTHALDSFDIIEADDKYSFKLLQHLLSLTEGNEELVRAIVKGSSGPALNPAGGALAVGNLVDASSLHRVYEAVLQLRGEAGGRRQVAVDGRGYGGSSSNAKRALVQSWRGVPTASGGAAILSTAEV
jgi:acetyl-CoA C-acetyltransferase